MFNDLLRAIGDCFKALGFVFEHRMAHFFLYPIAITILLSVGLIATVDWLVEGIDQYVSDNWSFRAEVTTDEGWFETGWRYVQNFSDYALAGIVDVGVTLGLFYLFHKLNKYIVLVLMSPVMSLVSERTDEKLTGREFPFEWPQLFKDIWRGVLIAMRNFAIEMGIIIAVCAVNLAITAVVPPLAIITLPAGAVFTWLVGAYFFGFATIDYTNERRRLNVKESVAFIRANKGIALGNGIVFAFLMWIPLIGAYIGPVFATIMCTVGATLTIHDKVNLNRDDFYLQPTD